MKMWLKTGIKLLVLWSCLFGIAKGSCISYGHSCWGAHGKRSSPQAKKVEDEWNILKLIPENNDQYKSDMNARLLSDNGTPFFDNPKIIDSPVIFGPTSDESQNNISHRTLPKRRFLFSIYDRQMDTSSPEDSDSNNANPIRGEDFKIRNYRLLKILKNDPLV